MFVNEVMKCVNETMKCLSTKGLGTSSGFWRLFIFPGKQWRHELNNRPAVCEEEETRFGRTSNSESHRFGGSFKGAVQCFVRCIIERQATPNEKVNDKENNSCFLVSFRYFVERRVIRTMQRRWEIF